jgi:acyl transferase domain-containing protein
MDPQQRLLLEETWKCIEDSGVALNTLKDKTTSVYVGCTGIDYFQNVNDEKEIDGYCTTGVFFHTLSGRISFF